MSESNTNTIREIDIPKNMNIIEKSNLIEFEYRWFKAKYFISLLATPFCAYFLIKSEYIIGDFNQLTIPVILLIAFTALVIYYSLAKLLNTTRIHVNNQEIRVQSGPLPMNKNLILKKSDVKQLYVTQHRIGHRYYVYATTYQINVILADKNVITLVKGLDTPHQGRFIEHKIEDFLDITDIHVEGELEKN